MEQTSFLPFGQSHPLSDFLKAGKYPVTFSTRKDSGRFSSDAVTIEVVGKKVNLPEGLSFLADVPEFWEFRLQMSEQEIREIVRKYPLILGGNSQKGFLVTNRDGNTLALSMSNGRCGGIQRLRKEPRPIQLTIRSDKQLYQIGEEIIIFPELKNTSNQPVKRDIFYKPGPISFYFKNESDKEWHSLSMMADVLRRIMPTEFAAGQSVQMGQYRLDLLKNDKYKLLTNEDYKITSVLKLYMVDGNLISDLITVEVVEKKKLTTQSVDLDEKMVESWGGQRNFFTGGNFEIVNWEEAKKILRLGNIKGGKQYHTGWLTIYTLDENKYLTKQPQMDALWDFMKENNLSLEGFATE